MINSLSRTLTIALIGSLGISLIFVSDAHAYIDPGSGSYILQYLIAAFLGVLFTIKIYWRRIRLFISQHLARSKK
jgi:hypothetical protein